MQRSVLAKNFCRHIVGYRTPCDVFINHRGIDTKKNVAGLIYDELVRMKLRPFLDSKSMKPGDKLFDKIDSGIRNCRLGIAVFSPTYCESYFCLHELSLIMDCKKRVIPIFVDVKPSELLVKNGVCPPREVERFNLALQEAKFTVGLTFDSIHGYVDWFTFDITFVVSCYSVMIESWFYYSGWLQRLVGNAKGCVRCSDEELVRIRRRTGFSAERKDNQDVLTFPSSTAGDGGGGAGTLCMITWIIKKLASVFTYFVHV